MVWKTRIWKGIRRRDEGKHDIIIDLDVWFFLIIPVYIQRHKFKD